MKLVLVLNVMLTVVFEFGVRFPRANVVLVRGRGEALLNVVVEG